MFYDDVVVAAYTPEPTPAPTPAPSSNYAEDDFESYTDDDETLSGWSFYVNVFGRNDDGSNGAYEYGYGGAAPNASHPNQSQISSIESSEAGVDGNATKYLKVFANYGDDSIGSKNHETNVFREYTVAEADVGKTLTFTWNGKKPSEGTVCGDTNDDTGGTAILCQAFIKVLNPGNGYAAEPGVYADTSGYGKDAWDTTGTLSVDIVAGMVGWPLQFGFSNTGGAYHPSAMLYDNMVVAVADTATTPTASDLFISETSEVGSNWTKYLEVANFTGADVSLDQYFLGRVSNAPSVVGEYEVAIEFTSGATIANGDVWVLGRAEGTDGPDALRNNIDQIDSGISHNGDDAYKLFKKASASDSPSQSATVVDVFGDYQGDPGSDWTACGDSQASSESVMIKKATKAGTDSWTTSAGTNADDCWWEITKISDQDAHDYATVGSHTFTGE
tara:strand:- start:203 stop:1537 length:1335 start_codon:yes stop_codon:yes gene_type:complete